MSRAFVFLTGHFSFAVWRFFKPGGLGSYDPQIIKPPAVLLFGKREAVENFDEGIAGPRTFGMGWVGGAFRKET